jgi:hypothetical protein
LHHLTETRFGSECAHALATLIADVHDASVLAQVGDYVVQVADGAQLLAAVNALLT